MKTNGLCDIMSTVWSRSVVSCPRLTRQRTWAAGGRMCTRKAVNMDTRKRTRTPSRWQHAGGGPWVGPPGRRPRRSQPGPRRRESRFEQAFFSDGSIWLPKSDKCIVFWLRWFMRPPAPMNHVKYLRAGPAEMPFLNWYTANTNNLSDLTDSVKIKWKTQPDWGIKPVTHDLVRRIRFRRIKFSGIWF